MPIVDSPSCVIISPLRTIELISWRVMVGKLIKLYSLFYVSFDLHAYMIIRFIRWSADKANGGELEALGFKEGYRVDVDVPESSWAKAPSFHDILIFNTGHW